MQMRYYIYT